MDIKEAIVVLTRELKSDAGYYEGWKSNIAMSYKDCEAWYKNKNGKIILDDEDIHIISNNAADHFLKLLCNDNK